MKKKLFHFFTFSLFNFLNLLAATGVLEDLPNTAPVVTNEEDAVAMAAVGALEAATSNQVAELSSAFRTGLADGTNAVLQTAMGAVAAESNRVDATYAKRSEIPAAPDLAPYALKSELPQDYLTENDITNFATRAWIEAQGYGTGADMGARIDAQNLAIDAATNAVLRDFRLKIDDLRLGTNALAVAHRTDVNALRAADTALSNRLDTATNALARDFRLKIDDLRLGTNALARDFRLKIDDLRLGTNALWYAMKEGTNRLWAAHTAESNRVNAATNAIWIAHKTDANALRAADTALSNRLDAATRNLDTAWRAGTNALRVALAATSNNLQSSILNLQSSTASGTNRLWQALASASNRMDRATNEVMRIVRAESNRLDTATRNLDTAWRAGTNATMRAVRAASNELARADARLDAKIDALELTGGMTRLWSSDATIYQDATGTVWQVQDTTLWTGRLTDVTRTYSVEDWTFTNEVSDATRWAEPSRPQYEVAWDPLFGGWSILEDGATVGECMSPAATNYLEFSQCIQIHPQWVGDLLLWRVAMTVTSKVDRVLYASDNIAADLTPATNYTDAVAANIRQSYIPIDGGPIYPTVELFLNNLLHEQGMLLLELPSGGSVGAAAFVGSTQITNQGAVAVAEGLAARKQDALPYPTNAIPYAAIDGAPSGGGTPEWREEWGSVSMGDSVIFVTNGIFVLSFDGAEATDPVMAYTGGWPDGAAMFVRGSAVSGPYQIANNIRLVGYGTWPTNDFQSVWWRSGTNIFVNILVEE